MTASDSFSARRRAPMPRRPLPSLGPFRPLPVPDCLEFTSFDESNPAGGKYMINTSRVPQLKSLVPNSGSGRLSPASPVSLGLSSLRSAQIPLAAVRFAFAYPLEGIRDEADALELDLLDPLISFAAIGGFVYWDDHGAVCGINALCEGNGLYFTGPYRLGHGAAALRELLYSSDADGGELRVQPVTIASLVHKGVKGFCWISAGEKFEGVESVRWPHGAFVYFYDEEKKESDCLFPVSEAPENEERLAVHRFIQPVHASATAPAGKSAKSPAKERKEGPLRPFEVDLKEVYRGYSRQIVTARNRFLRRTSNQEDSTPRNPKKVVRRPSTARLTPTQPQTTDRSSSTQRSSRPSSRGGGKAKPEAKPMNASTAEVGTQANIPFVCYMHTATLSSQPVPELCPATPGRHTCDASEQCDLLYVSASIR